MSQKEGLKRLMEEKGLSLASISRALGMSTAAISQYLAGIYPGNVAKIDDSVKGFLQRASEKASSGRKRKLDFYLTSQAKRYFEVARTAHLEGVMGLLIAESGLGKTTAGKEYARRNSDCIFIEADMGYTARVLFREICKGLKIEPKPNVGAYAGSLHEMLEAVVERLRGSGRLIIIDEAEHLPYRGLELLRRVHDKAEAGILLVGMPRLLNNLTGRGWEYKQLYRRILAHGKMEELKAADTEEIVRKELQGDNQQQGLWQAFHREAAGNMAYLEMLLHRAGRIAGLNNIEITEEVIKRAGETLLRGRR